MEIPPSRGCSTDAGVHIPPKASHCPRPSLRGPIDQRVPLTRHTKPLRCPIHTIHTIHYLYCQNTRTPYIQKPPISITSPKETPNSSPHKKQRHTYSLLTRLARSCLGNLTRITLPSWSPYSSSSCCCCSCCPCPGNRTLITLPARPACLPSSLSSSSCSRCCSCCSRARARLRLKSR